VQRRNTNKGEKMGTPPAPAYNLPGTNSVLLKDGTACDTLIGNYLSYYQLYAQWNSNNLSASDSINLLALAQLCPHIDGAVIYEARALKQVITHDYSPYANDCDGGGGSARMLAALKEQKYWVSPNPNDGTMQLHQTIRNEDPVSVTVYDVLGAVIAKKSIHFTGMLSDLRLTDIVPGMYYLNLQDSSGSIYTMKFLKR
ncbi:MAG: T9SS type A sorting domain-containing protein, partial [Chitinophagaceae bacterium]